MNTKTMRLPPRRVLYPTKRREKDDFDLGTAAKSPAPQIGLAKGDPSVHSNQLLAGYLAHEFLSRGTLFGKPWDPAGVQAESPEPKRSKPNGAGGAELGKGKDQRYVEVAGLLKTGGAHLDGIVNPTELARFLEM